MMKRFVLFLLLFLLGTVNLFAQTVPQTMTFQGRLAKPDGTPVPDNPTQSLTIRLFSAPTGGSALWSQTTSVAVRNGVFTMPLDFSTGYQSGNTLSSVFGNQLFLPYLEIQVGSDAPLSPRQPYASVAYSLYAGAALSVPDGSITLNKLAPGVLSFANLSGTILPSQIAAGSITGDKLASGTITGDKIAADTITSGNLSSSLQLILGTLGVTLAPALRGSVGTDSHPYCVAVLGNYAYVANATANSLQIFDVSNSASPVLKGTVGTATRPFSVAVSGHYAFVSNFIGRSLQVFDVSNPASPTLQATVSTISQPNSVTVANGYAYVACLSFLQIFDVSNPASPNFRSNLNLGGSPQSIAVSGNYAYITNTSNALQICDVSNPSGPALVGTVGTGNNPASIAVSGLYAYVVNGNSSSLQVFDVSNPASPTLKTTVGTGSGPASVVVSNGYAFVVNSGSNTLQSFDVSSPTSPTLKATVGTDVIPQSVAVGGGNAYVVNAVSNTLQIFSLYGLALTNNLALRGNLQFPDGSVQTTSFQGAAAGGDLTGTYPNPSIADSAVTNNKLASDASSLNKVSGGAMSIASGNVSITATGGASSNLPRGVHLGIDTSNNTHIEVVGGTPYIDFNSLTTGDYQARLILQDNGIRLNLIAPNVRVTGNFENLSDARFKQKIAPLSDALESILNLHGVSYEWKPNVLPGMSMSEGRELGFLAQEVEAVLPQLVHTDTKGIKAVNYQGVIPVLVEAMKAFHAKATAQASEVKSLRKENAELKAALAKILQRLDKVEASHRH